MDRLQSMAVFVRAVETGSFSAAGAALGMSSQLVGKHVAALEQHLRLQLITRTTRRHHLTEAGAAYFERVKIILAEVEASEGTAALSRGTARGRLRIAAPVSFGVHALARHLPDYLAAHPDVTVDLALSNRTVDLIEEGIDLAFRVGALSDSGLIARSLAPYRLRLCAAPAYLANHPPITHPQELQAHECLGFSHSDLRRRWSFDGPEGMVSVAVSGRLMIDSGEALLVAARAGLGLLLQPCELVRDDLARGRLVEVLPNWPIPVRPFHLLHGPDRRMTPKLRSFIDFALSVFGPGAETSTNRA